jgi:hypothetical protein
MRGLGPKAPQARASIGFCLKKHPPKTGGSHHKPVDAFLSTSKTRGSLHFLQGSLSLSLLPMKKEIERQTARQNDKNIPVDKKTQPVYKMAQHVEKQRQPVAGVSLQPRGLASE